jgi:hypothetical protein
MKPIIAAPGDYALDFLNIPMCPSSAALGQGNFAGISGPEAIYYNPALIAQSGVFASHQQLLLDSQSNAIALATGIGKNIAIGIGAMFFDPGIIQGYSTENLKTGTVKAGDRLIRMAISHTGKLSYGISISSYTQRLGDQIGSGFGAGAGLSYENDIGKFALTADNIGPSFEISGVSFPLPARTSLSSRLPVYSNLIHLNIDISYKSRIGLSGAAGLEMLVVKGLAMRIGTNELSHASIGFGLISGKLGIDYSYLPPGDFGDRHLFSFGLRK